jgi:tRNA(Ile)-lysidine synthase
MPLLEVAPAIRRRLLRLAALRAGCPGGDLSAVHIAALDGLLTDWHGQRRVDLPGPVGVVRRGSTLELAPAEPPGSADPGRLPADARRPAH